MDQNNEEPRVVFEGENFKRSNRSFQARTPKMIGWVIKYSGGLVKDENQANYLLIGFAVVALAISFYLFFGSGQTQQKPSAEMLKQLEQLKIIPVKQ